MLIYQDFFLYVCIRHTQLIRAFQLQINKIQKRKRFCDFMALHATRKKKNLIFGNPVERTERRYNIGFSYQIEIRKVIYNFYFHSLQHHTLFSLDHVYQIIHTSIFPVIFILHNGLTPFWLTHPTKQYIGSWVHYPKENQNKASNLGGNYTMRIILFSSKMLILI